MQQNSNERIVYLDLLRTLATFAVIMAHVFSVAFKSQPFCPSWYYAVVCDSLVRWCVPVFFMISGALFLIPHKTVTFKDVLSKYVLRLVVAYVFWAVIYYLIEVIKGHTLPDDLGVCFYHLWFLPILMGIYLLIPLLRKLPTDRALIQYLLIVWLVLSFVRIVPVVPSHFVPLVTNDFIGYVGYFILGYFLSTISFSKRRVCMICVLGVLGGLFTIIGTVVISKHRGDTSEWFFRNMCPNILIMAVAMFVFIKGIAYKCGKLVLWFVSFVRKDLFGVYLVHILWLNILLPRIAGLGEGAIFKVVLYPLVSVVIFVFSLFTTKLIRQIPIIRKVVE